MSFIVKIDFGGTRDLVPKGPRPLPNIGTKQVAYEDQTALWDVKSK